MTNDEAVCHDKCYKSMFSTLLYCQRRFIEENNLHQWFYEVRNDILILFNFDQFWYIFILDNVSKFKY